MMKLLWLTIVGGCCFVGMATARSSAKLNPKEAAGGGGGGGGNGGGRPSLTTYDQRQTGKYNIHVNIKDVKIISVDGEKFDGEFGDDTIYDYGDYDYDPSHLTISPLPIFGSGSSSTTAKPPKSTTKTPVPITSTKRPTTTTTTTTEAPSIEEDEESIEPMEPSKRPVIADDDPMKIEANPSYPVHNSSSSSQMLHAPIGTTTPPSSNIYIFKPTPNYHPHPVHYDYQEIPVEVIVEPVLKPKYRNANSRISAVANRRNRYRKNPGSAGSMDSMSRHSHSNIEALPSPGEQQQPQQAPLEATPCGKGEFRDRSGKCRTRRSGGGIFRLLNLLTAFKEKDD